MQWSTGVHAGFSQGRPWLRLADDWATHNVGLQQADAASMLALYRRLIALRRAEPALHAGAWEPVDAGADVVAYARTFSQRRLVVLLNFAEAPRDIDGSVVGAKADVLSSTRHERAGLQGGLLTLQALEGVVLAYANE